MIKRGEEIAEMNDDPRIAELLDRWEDLLDQGQQVSPEELCRECPDLVAELRQRIDRLQWVGELLETGPLEGDANSDSLQIPPMLGRYRLDERTGEGGFGQVWKGYDPELERVVAIKILRPERHSSVFQVARFLDEAKSVAKLRHPNIVAVYDVGRDQGFCFIVTELIAGEDLASCMKRGKVAWSEATNIVTKVADALQHAHERAIIHRDIKPHNILLDENSQPFLTDFGIAVTAAALLDENSDASGTLSYMSPEQANIGGPAIDQRSDVYGLGVVLYELLTGSPPHVVKKITKLREQFQASEVPTPRSVDSTIPVDLDQVCMKALAIEPSKRWTDAGEFAAALRKCTATSRPRVLTPRLVLVALAVLIVVAAIYIARLPRGSDSTGPIAERPEQVAIEPSPKEQSSTSIGTPAASIPLRIFEGHTGEITSCLTSADNRYVISTATHGDGTLVWEIESGERILGLDHDSRFAFLTDEGRIVSFGAVRIPTVTTWELQSGKEVESVPFSGCRWRASLASNANVIAYIRKSTVMTYDLDAKKDLLVFLPTGSPPFGVAISQDGKLAVTGEQSGRVMLWNAETGESIRELYSHKNYVQAVAISPNSRLVLSASWDNTARVFDLDEDVLIRRHDVRLAYTCAFSPDGRRYAVAGEGVVEVFNSDSGEKVTTINGHNGKLITYVSFSADSKLLVSGGRDFKVCLWPIDE